MNLQELLDFHPVEVSLHEEIDFEDVVVAEWQGFTDEGEILFYGEKITIENDFLGF